VANLKVFILGPARSGTSITYYALHEVLGLPGRGESHIIPLFQRLLHLFFQYAKEFAPPRGELASQLDTRAFKQHLLPFLCNFYEKTYPGGDFVDKTPGAEAILGAALVREVFPDSYLIFTRRTGIEVVQSFQRKFSTDFEASCNAWVHSMTALTRVRPSLSNFLEVDQFDIANAPQQVAKQIAQYLGVEEKTDPLAKFLLEHRTDQHSDHNWQRRLTLPNVSWSDEQKSTFTRICGGLMQEFGYPLT
jgi:sulfotransferase family protein